MRIIRAVGAALMLLALLVGLPIVLLTVAGSPLPESIPTLSQVVSALSHPDSGQLALLVLEVVAWLAWASFTVSVLVELRNHLSSRPRLVLRGLGWQQNAAATLVAALLLGAATPTSAAAAVTTPVASVAASIDQSTDPAPAHEAPTATEQSPTWVVADGDSLWTIAQRTLGEGSRWQEIADLNYARVQADGHALTSAHWLNAGWELQLPAGAAVAAEQPGSTTSSDGERVVGPGETLASIAAAELGEAQRWPEIYDASTHTVQDDGRQLTDPDLIRPGWVLTMPKTADATAPVVEEVPEDVATPEHRAAEAPAPPAPPVVDEAPAAPPAPSIRDSVDVAEDVAEAAAEADTADTVRTAGGIGLLGAAAILGLLAVRRARARREHPEVVPFPDLDSEESQLEAQLNVVADTVTLAQLDVALRSLTQWHRQADQALPELAFARLVDGAIQLYLRAPAALPAPWRDAHESTVWELDVTTLDGAAPGVCAPWPALVPLGTDDEGGELLVDLEQAPSLDLRGGAAAAQATLTSIASTLALSPWAEDLQVTLVSTMGGFADALGLDRVRHVTGVDQVIAELEERAALVSDALAEDDVASAAAARGRGLALDAWRPEVLIIPDTLDETTRQRLDAVLARVPRVGVATVTRDAGHGSWSLDLTADEPARATLQPAGITLTPQQLSPTEYDQIVALLGATAPEPVPAPPAQAPAAVPPEGPAPLPEASETSVVLQLPRPGTPATRITAVDLYQQPDLGTLSDRPVLALLGPVTLPVTPGTVPAQLSVHAMCLDLIAYLHEHGPASSDLVTRAMWPMKREVAESRVHQTVSRARSWLGQDTAGEFYLPRVKTGEPYRVERLATDYDLMLDLIDPNLAGTATDDLIRALQLVRGRPLSQPLNPDGTVKARTQRFSWAEPYRVEKISTILDLAHEIASRAIASGDHQTATWAADKALTVETNDERLWRDAITAAWLAGDQVQLEEHIDALNRALDQMDVEPESETLELVEHVRTKTPQMAAS